MKSLVMVRYEVKPDRVAENEDLVRAVFDELATTEPAGIGYVTFALEDGVSFVHIATTDLEGSTPLSDVCAFRRFRAALDERAVAPPTFAPLRQVGSYGALDG